MPYSSDEITFYFPYYCFSAFSDGHGLFQAFECQIAALFAKLSPFGIRISEQPLSYHDQVLSIPFYLLPRMGQLIEEIAQMA